MITTVLVFIIGVCIFVSGLIKYASVYKEVKYTLMDNSTLWEMDSKKLDLLREKYRSAHGENMIYKKHIILRYIISSICVYVGMIMASISLIMFIKRL